MIVSLVSAIIPVFNSEETIKETVESMLNQTFLELELIVMDGGSPDLNSSVVSTTQDLRLGHLRH
ncbi:MAG: glycosyltransferase [Myxacorys chilensis ATA2-1-KO14]|nr:glycosyltransferase [Myxacorys chilensis ATA2-1-KO14]